MNDPAYTFEKLVSKIFGKPQSQAKMTGYYNDANKTGFQYILYTLCIYEYHYNEEFYTPKERNELYDYTKKAEGKESTHSDDLKILEFLAQKHSI